MKTDPVDMLNFFKTSVWSDIRDELYDALLDGHLEIEKDLDAVQTAFLRGKISQLRLIMELPEVYEDKFKSEIETKELEQEMENDDA